MSVHATKTKAGVVIKKDAFDEKWGMAAVGSLEGTAVLPTGTEIFEDDLGRECVRLGDEVWTLAEAVYAAYRDEIPGSTFTPS
ncbi:hypothetical protein [Halomonas colorata]|uniref:Uncharacterized protein n=1 Tax=Halomonas colorata TaxID=2742615 RepID=A0ABR9G3J5_9GAMM|nr:MULTISPECIES: hypothetical protein [Halomonas]MBE0465484.1 hypothetical protein [Halomonas colorata]